MLDRVAWWTCVFSQELLCNSMRGKHVHFFKTHCTRLPEEPFFWPVRSARNDLRKKFVTIARHRCSGCGEDDSSTKRRSTMKTLCLTALAAAVICVALASGARFVTAQVPANHPLQNLNEE